MCRPALLRWLSRRQWSRHRWRFHTITVDDWTMEEVLRRENLTTNLKRVQTNQGAPGIDGMTVHENPAYVRQGWPSIRELLPNTTDELTSVQTMYRPELGEDTRMFGMRTVRELAIAQAIL
jgi:RNA-directed DNA polymerase